MASLLSGYEYDIFVSYRQKDNKHDGWVTSFVEHLKGELESTFKEDISIDQQPVNPWTFECGFMVGISDRVEIMTELGSNFNDAAISVVTVSYRF